MEPASFAASILTLLAAAGAASEFVYNFILDIDDIPEEIHSQAIKIQCLHGTFTSLINMYTHDTQLSEVQLDPFFQAHLESFMSEIHALETKLRRSSTKMSSSRKQQVWAKLKWLSSDRKLRKFYSKLDDWMRVFLTALHTTEMFNITAPTLEVDLLIANRKLLTKIVDQTSQPYHLRTVACQGWRHSTRVGNDSIYSVKRTRH
jgi:hypothetical protein